MESALHEDQKFNLLDLGRQGLTAFFAERGEKAFRASQVLQWIHRHGMHDFDGMTNLGKTLRDELRRVACVRAGANRYRRATSCGWNEKVVTPAR